MAFGHDCSDMGIFEENISLKSKIGELNAALQREGELANRWRLISRLRRLNTQCRYQLITERSIPNMGNVIRFWTEQLGNGGWGFTGAIQDDTIQKGITIRIGTSDIAEKCAQSLQLALTDIYPNPRASIADNQRSDFLNECRDCVQIEIHY